METLGKKAKEALSRPEVREGLQALLNPDPAAPPKDSVHIPNGETKSGITLKIESPK